MHSGNVFTYRYMNSRREVLGMLCDSVRILHAINTNINLQGIITESEFRSEIFSFIHLVLTYFRHFYARFVNRE